MAVGREGRSGAPVETAVVPSEGSDEVADAAVDVAEVAEAPSQGFGLGTLICG